MRMVACAQLTRWQHRSVADIVRMAHAVGTCLVDGRPTLAADILEALDRDFYVFSAHRLFWPPPEWACCMARRNYW
jgi:selenocysteine lyase/cysteine desulfurase